MSDLEGIRARPRTFVGGRVVTIHTVGRYAVVEYINGDRRAGEVFYRPYVDGVDTHTSLRTLEEAFVLAFARGAHSDPNLADRRYAECACILLRSEP